MSKNTVGIGTVANDGTGDSLREAGGKLNTNFDEIYTTFGDGLNLFQGYVLNGDEKLNLAISTMAPVGVGVGTVAVADGIIWNPSNKEAHVPYPVFYDGLGWAALNELANLTGVQYGSVMVYKNNRWNASIDLDAQDISGGHY
jgi:hypothetical protein